MEEHGVIVQNKEHTVLIKAQRSTSCDNCSSKKSCHGGSTGSGDDLYIEAENPIGAKVGDRVIFSVSSGSVLKAGVLLYLFPILSFIAGVALGQAYVAGVFPSLNPDLVSGVLGVLFLALAFIGLKLYSRLIERGKAFRPHVLRVE